MNLADKGIIIRKTSEWDLREIYLSAQGNSGFRCFDFSADYLADLFSSEEGVMYSAVRKKKVLGFITGRDSGSSLKIETIFVSQRLRRGGIGSALLEKFVSRAKKTGANDIDFAVHGESSDLAEFLVSRGFVPESSTVNFRKMEL